MYGNPYYEPYRGYNQEYLEHYGVKGMKWGVRKDPERSGATSRRGTKAKADLAARTKRSHEILKEQVSYPYDNKSMQYAVDVFNYRAKQYYWDKKGWDIDKQTGEYIGNKEEDTKLMQEAYDKAAESYTELERELLAMYIMLKQLGMTKRFSVVLYGDTTDSRPSLGLYDLQKKDIVPTLEEAQKRMRLDKNTSRRRKVDPNAKPVRPRKSDQPADIGSTANPYFAGSVDPLKSLNVDKKLKHSAASIDYSQYYVSVGAKVIRNLGRFGTLRTSI